MKFRVLGPVELMRDGDPIAVDGNTTLSLLAGLLTTPNQVISGQTIARWIWDTRLPQHPRAAVHNGISRLRKLVGKDRIGTSTWGYRLHADAGDLDLLRFDHLVSSARQAIAKGMAEHALAALDEAVGLWREPLLGNVTSQQLRGEAVPRLTERYLNAVEERAELCLQLGHQRALADELSAVLRAHPFRERVARQLMIVLVRSERQVDALAVYDRLRRDLNDELGIDPAVTLQELRVKILRADPDLGIVARSGVTAP